MFKTKIVIGAGITGFLAYQTLKSVDWRRHLSTLCEWLSDDLEVDSDVVVDAFTKTTYDPVPLTEGHTHPTAAALRTSARNMADTIARHTGSDLYIVQMSKSDQRKGYSGTRQWYWAKDTKVNNRNDTIKSDDVGFICDVDYYIDMNKLLTDHVRPIIIYSVVPEKAASIGENETSFFFLEDGKLSTTVAGGGHYEHLLWDYGKDSVKCTSKTLGFTTSVTTYAIERKQVGKHRQLILLTPLMHFRGIAAWIADWLIEPTKLSRFKPIKVGVDGTKFVRFNVTTADCVKITTGRPNTYICATVDACDDAAVCEVAKLGSTKLMLPTTSSWLGKEQRHAAAILTAYYRACQETPSPTVFPVSQSVRGYQFEPRFYDQEARPKLEAFMSPLVHEAFVPVPNAAGERQCVEGRINQLKKGEPKFHRFRDQCISEFAELVVAGATLVPVDYETIEDKQDSAAQKQSLKKAVLNGPFVKNVLKCFIKAEAYGGVKDPRNISTYNDSDKLGLSGFALALSEHCKQFLWYGPGMKPIDIARRVSQICVSAKQLVNLSDYHRMDGTVTAKLREVDQAVFMKAFKHHRTELNELLRRNSNNFGILPHGTTFDQGSSHGSGSADTSLSQTLRAAFTAYLAFRHHRSPEGRGLSPREAFSRLGIHLGDDGLDADLPVNDHKWAADRVGLVLEAAVVERGERGINFLARYYSKEVWNGSPNSMCDIRRQLSKFHTTRRLPDNVKPEEKLVEKARAYVATDGNTPVIGQLCKQVLVLKPQERTARLGVGTWWSKFESSEQFPNDNDGNWMDVEFDIMLPEFDRDLFNSWVSGTKQISEVIEAPLCCQPRQPSRSTVDVVVDGDILDASKKEETKETNKERSTQVHKEESATSRNGNRRRRRRGITSSAPQRKTSSNESSYTHIPKRQPVKPVRDN